MFSLSNGYTDETLKSIRQNGGTEPKPREISLGELAKKGRIVGVKAISSQAESRLVKMPQAFLFGVTRFFTPSDLACTMVVCRTLKVQLSKDVFWKAFAQKILWPIIESPFQREVCKYYADQTEKLVDAIGGEIREDQLKHLKPLFIKVSYKKAVSFLPYLKDEFRELALGHRRHEFIEADLVEYVEMVHDVWSPSVWDSAFKEAAYVGAMKVLKWFPLQKLSREVKFQALCETVNLVHAVKHGYYGRYEKAIEAAKFILSIEPFSDSEKRKAIKESWIFKMDLSMWSYKDHVDRIYDKIIKIIELFKCYVVIPSDFKVLLLKEGVRRNFPDFVEWQLPTINEEEIIEICECTRKTPALELVLKKISSLPEPLRVKLLGMSLKLVKLEAAKLIYQLAPISKEGLTRIRKMIDSEIPINLRKIILGFLDDWSKQQMKKQESCVIQ